MGIVNVTPDSFSDGGRFLDADAAIRHGRQLIAEGADILDIGGESTRPGAEPVSEEDEIARVVPVIQGLAATGVPLSVDTRHGGVMTAALAAGATILNDVAALREPGALAVAAASNAWICLMHMRGDPGGMQTAPTYGDVVAEVMDFLAKRIRTCEEAGIERHRIAIDPGIGFGKTLEHNLALLRHLKRFGDLGCPVLLGVSRKSFIAQLSRGEPATGRLPGSLAAALAGVEAGARVLRVHDVAATRQAVDVWRALSPAPAVAAYATELGIGA